MSVFVKTTSEKFKGILTSLLLQFLFSIILLSNIAEAGELNLIATLPSKNEGIDCLDSTGTELTDLKEIRIYGLRCMDTVPLYFGAIPCQGKEGDTIAVNLIIQDGTVGTLWSTAADFSGNESCKGSEYTFAIPATQWPREAFGLSGDYFDNEDFTGYKFTRVDSTINFDWNFGSPDPSMGADGFSMLWRGYITVPTEDVYTFYSTVEDGDRLWIANTSVIDDFAVAEEHGNLGQITLPAGKYPITLEYHHHNTDAIMKLFYSTPSITKQIVPYTMLSH